MASSPQSHVYREIVTAVFASPGVIGTVSIVGEAVA
jgi:hypothetical protein